MKRSLMAPILSALLLAGAAGAQAQLAGDPPPPADAVTQEPILDPVPVTDPAAPPPAVVVTEPTPPPTDTTDTTTSPPAPGGTDVVVTEPVPPTLPVAPLPRPVQSLERNLAKNPGNPGLTNALERVRANHGLAPVVERPATIERVTKVERVERPERVEKVEKVERPERVERIEKPQRVERPERPERGNGRG